MPSAPGISMSRRHTSGCVQRDRSSDLVAPGDLGHDLEVWLEVEQGGERSAHQRLVIGEQQTDRRRSPRHLQLGAAAGGAPGPRSSPPEPSTRSRRPRRPLPISSASTPRPSSVTTNRRLVERDGAELRTGMADDVGDRLAQHPGRHGASTRIEGSRQSAGRSASIPAACSATVAAAISSSRPAARRPPTVERISARAWRVRVWISASSARARSGSRSISRWASSALTLTTVRL